MLGTASGLALASGINAYLPLFVLGLVARGHNVTLRPGFDWLTSLPVLALLLCLGLLDLVADKIPGVDHVWDVLHTATRPLGAFLCVAAVLDVGSPVARTLLVFTGGAIGLSVHTGKAAARIVATAGGGGLLSLPISILEDLAVCAVLILSFVSPQVTLALAAVVLVVLIALAPLLWHIFRLQLHLLRSIGNSLLGSATDASPERARQQSLFRVPNWAHTAVHTLTGPDEPPRCALRVTVGGLPLPRHCWLVVTDKQLLLAGRPFGRGARVYSIALLYIRVARLDRSRLFAALDLIDLDGRRLRLRLLESDNTLIQDVAAATSASLPADARASLPGARPRVRRIG